MAQFIQYPLPDNISEAYLRALRERVAARRKAEAMVREILGERDEKPEMNLFEYLLTFPKVDIDFSIFDRNAHLRGKNVSD